MVPLRVPVRRRDGDRRGVLGDQLRHRRADPRQVPRPGRSGHQRHLLGRRDAGRPRQLLAAGHQPIRREHRLADRVLHRSGARFGDHLPPPAHPGEPALDGDPRQVRGGRGDRRGHRGRCPGPGQAAARDQGLRSLVDQGARGLATQAARLRVLQALSVAHLPGSDADDHPVVPLQRDLLHLAAGAAELLRSDAVECRAVLLPVRGRATCSARCCWVTSSTPSAGAR